MTRSWRSGLASVSLALSLTLGACAGEPEGDPQTVTVPAGASFDAVVDTLAALG